MTEEELTAFCLASATQLIVNSGQPNVQYDQVVGIVTVDYQLDDPDFAICDRIWGLIGSAVVTIAFPA